MVSLSLFAHYLMLVLALLNAPKGVSTVHVALLEPNGKITRYVATRNETGFKLEEEGGAASTGLIKELDPTTRTFSVQLPGKPTRNIDLVHLNLSVPPQPAPGLTETVARDGATVRVLVRERSVLVGTSKSADWLEASW